MDILHGEAIIELLFTFSKEEPLNDYMDHFEFGSMNFLPNTGSIIIPITCFMIVQFATFRFVHFVAKRYSSEPMGKRIGTYLYPVHNLLAASVFKLFLEGSLDMAISMNF